MEKLKMFLMKGNFLYKLISLALAVMIWFTVTQPFS